MKITTVTYQRVKNLGNYESKRLEISAELDDADDVTEAITTLKQKVREGLNIPEPNDDLGEPAL